MLENRKLKKQNKIAKIRAVRFKAKLDRQGEACQFDCLSNQV